MLPPCREEAAGVTGLACDTCHLRTEQEAGPLTSGLPNLLGKRESHFSKQRPTQVPRQMWPGANTKTHTVSLLKGKGVLPLCT